MPETKGATKQQIEERVIDALVEFGEEARTVKRWTRASTTSRSTRSTWSSWRRSSRTSTASRSPTRTSTSSKTVGDVVDLIAAASLVTGRVAITGVGAVTPLGVGARTLIERWAAGESGIRDGLAPCGDFEPTDHLSRREARRADRFTQLALVAAEEALGAGRLGRGAAVRRRRRRLRDRHRDRRDLRRSRTSTPILRERGPGAMSPLCVPQMMPNAAAGAVAMRHGLRGECYGTVSACAAGAQAIGAGHADGRARRRRAPASSAAPRPG